MNDNVIIRRIASLPANIGAFVSESAETMGELYGAAAAKYYLDSARGNLEAAVGHATVYALAAFEGANAVGIVMASRRARAAHLSYIHILRSHEDRAIENRLVEQAVADLTIESCAHILCEHVPVGRLDLIDTFLSLGFTHVPRLVMTAPLDSPELTPESDSCRPIDTEDFAETARCFVDAYRADPGRSLHIEMTDDQRASGFLTRVAAGGFGRFRPEYMRAIVDDGRCLGTAIGCEVTPDTGFILQVAVRPESRRRGMGTALVHSLAAAFRTHGLRQAALGVTADNPARALYERIGFRARKPLDAFVWWRPGREP